MFVKLAQILGEYLGPNTALGYVTSFSAIFFFFLLEYAEEINNRLVLILTRFLVFYGLKMTIIAMFYFIFQYTLGLKIFKFLNLCQASMLRIISQMTSCMTHFLAYVNTILLKLYIIFSNDLVYKFLILLVTLLINYFHQITMKCRQVTSNC